MSEPLRPGSPVRWRPVDREPVMATVESARRLTAGRGWEYRLRLADGETTRWLPGTEVEALGERQAGTKSTPRRRDTG